MIVLLIEATISFWIGILYSMNYYNLIILIKTLLLLNFDYRLLDSNFHLLIHDKRPMCYTALKFTDS